ncbi:MAG: SsrA-binding protein SmpB [Candidatus Komeilibacteria bacterium]|nr:SsrA-binding protein SmpB [Candidatus Komeilibacteria bacterium]
MNPKANSIIIAENKAANYHYNLLEKFEAGLKLTGAEVKSAKLGQVHFKQSYISLQARPPIKAWLKNFYISSYKPAAQTQKNYNPMQPRELLLTSKELTHLIGKTQTKGLTIIPLVLYTTNSFLKLTIALASGKSNFDKRTQIKKRELDRQVQEHLKRSR